MSSDVGCLRFMRFRKIKNMHSIRGLKEPSSCLGLKVCRSWTHLCDKCLWFHHCGSHLEGGYLSVSILGILLYFCTILFCVRKWDFILEHVKWPIWKHYEIEINEVSIGEVNLNDSLLFNLLTRLLTAFTILAASRYVGNQVWMSWNACFQSAMADLAMET